MNDKNTKIIKRSEARDTIRQRNISFIVGGIAALVIMLVILIPSFSTLALGTVIVAIVAAYAAFAFVSQLFWGESVQDCFGFFLRSFTMPGLIFELDLDGIIWFITVKLLLSLLSIVLSVLLLLLGIFITAAYAAVAFPFALMALTKEIKELS